jgi:hypothetical protein
MHCIRIGLVVTVLAPIAVTYGAENHQLENLAPDLTEEEQPKDELLVGSDVDHPAKEVHGDTAAVDVENSINVDVDRKGWFLRADLRGGLFSRDTDLRDGSTFSDDDFKLKGRLEADIGIRENNRFKIRLAGVCSTDDCDPEVSVKSTTLTATSIVNGEITIDEAFLHRFRPRYDIAIGRMQTKFVARGGVIAKSMDRNDSHNMNINWTDGLHATWKSRFGWTTNLILQHNDSDGSSSIRRGPLDFHDPDSRVTYFVAMENLRPWGAIVQRGIDVSYLPASLLKDGDRQGRIEDYWGVVGRFAARWTVSEKRDTRFRISGEIAYAPETPTNDASGIGTSGDSDGLGWAVTAALMNFRPGHSFGLAYGRVAAGWLLSPQYRQNEELKEFRYVWRYRDNKSFEIRFRQRDELDRLVAAQNKRDDFDLFVRFTSRFTLLER